MTDLRTDITSARSDEMAVWVLEGAGVELEGLNLDPVRAGDVMYKPGTLVTFGDEHEMYPGEDGVIQAVGQGKGMHGGVTYDVLPDGCSESDRVSEYGIEEAE